MVATTSLVNTRSWRVMERLGMRREGRLAQYRWKKGQPRDHYLFALTRAEWTPAT